MILWEPVEGIAWLVAHDADTGAVTAAPELPGWASPELAAAAEDRLLASVTGRCPECGAVRAQAVGEMPHDPACGLSEESLIRLEEACRPPGRRWVIDTRPETMAVLWEYLAALAANLAQSLSERGGAGR